MGEYKSFGAQKFDEHELQVVDVGARWLSRYALRGAHTMLSEFKETVPSADVMSVHVPYPASQVVHIAVSSRSMRSFAGMAQEGVERHAAVSGPDSIASKIFGGTENESVGLLLAQTGESQRSINHSMRKSLDVPDEVAKEVVERIIFNSSRGVGAYDAVLSAVAEMFVPLFAKAAEPSSEIHEKMLRRAGTHLEAAAASIILRTSNLAGLTLSLARKQNIIPEDVLTSFTRPDAISAIAPLKATSSSIYWMIVRSGVQSNISTRFLAHETLRFDGSPSFTIPRGYIADKNPVELFALSPAAILQSSDFGPKPNTYNPLRFSDESLFPKVCKTAFGIGSHHCPSSSIMPRLLETVADTLREKNVHFEGSQPKNSVHQFIAKVPTNSTQGKIVTK